MPPEERPHASAARWWVAALALWMLLLLGVSARAVLWPRVHSLYPTYATAGTDWVSGHDLYYRERPKEHRLDQYRYSPLVAMLLTPWHFLPERMGGILWRLVNAGVFLGGLAWWLRAAAPRSLDARASALVFLLVVPLSLSSLNNGQPNVMMTGLLLIGLAAAAEDRWNVAALAMALAVALKVYPIAVALLLVAVYPRRFGPRLLAALLLVAVLPFLFQRPAYVLSQYASWYRVVIADDRMMWSWTVTYRDLWLLIRCWGLPIGQAGYLRIQLGLAALCALLCVAGRRLGWTRKPLLAMVWSLGAGWMMLCGPATESCTYIVLAPALTWALIGGSGPPLVFLSAYGLLLGGVVAGLLPQTSHLHSYGIQPLGALLYFGGILGGALVRFARRPGTQTGADIKTMEPRAA